MARCPVCGQAVADPVVAARVSANLERLRAHERKQHVAELRVVREKAARQLAEASKSARQNAERRAREKLDIERERHRLELQKTSESARSAERRRSAQQVETMRREIAGYQRRLEKMSSDERGEIGESQILAALRAAFPRDKIERLNKTRGSADIHHEVREGSKSCGTIVYECKDVRQWQKAYVAQARASRALHQASHAVLVSTAFPRSARYLCFVRDVAVVHPAIVTSVAQCLRQSLVVLAGTRGSPAERERRADRLLQYAKGDDFRRHMTGIAEAVIDLRDLQAKERQAHLRVWEQQAGYLDQVDSGHAKIHARIEAILEGTNEASLPEAAAS